MRRVLLFALLLLPQLLQAQEVFSHPFSEDNKVWRHEHMDFPGKYTRHNYTDGDTIIGDHQCYKLYACETSRNTPAKYEGAIYDEGRKTYIIKAGDTEPQLLYNFDVAEGDVFTLDGEELRVEKDTIMEFNNELYRNIKLFNITKSQGLAEYEAVSVWWIEGIGAITPYLTRPTYWSAYDHKSLAACYVNQELVYYNEAYTLDVPILRQTADADNSLYDLSGRKLPSLQGGVGGRLHKGVYIQGGKKFVVK